MTNEEREQLEALIPAWNSGSREACDAVVNIVLPWIKEFARLQVANGQKNIEVSNNFKIPTPIGLYDESEVVQDVLLAFVESQHKTSELTTPRHLYSMLHMVTHRMVLRKIAAVHNPGVARVPFSMTDTPNEDQLITVGDSEIPYIRVLQVLNRLSVKHHHCVLAFVMRKLKNYSVDAIQEVLGVKNKSQISRYIKLVSDELIDELSEVVEY